MENQTEQTQNQKQVFPTCIVVIVSAIAIILFIAGLIMNIFLRDSLFFMGINFIQDYQSSQPNQFVRAVYNLFTILGNIWFIVGLITILYLLMYRKLLVIVYLTYLLSNIYILGIMKPSFQQARPFWYTNKINQNQWGCQKQYGFPSGHSLLSALMYQPIVTQIILCQCLKAPFNKLLLILPILTSIFIPLSRLYLGSHSTDQIMFGLLMSYCSLVLYRYALQKIMYKLYQQVINPNKSIIIPITTFISFLIILIVPIIIYIVNINTKQINPLYIQNIKNVCNYDETYEQIEGNELQYVSYVFLIFGFLFGCMIATSSCFTQYEFYKKLGLYFTGRWSYVSIINIILVLLLYVLLIGPIIGFFFVALDFFLKNSIAAYLLKSFAAIMIGMIILILIPLICIKLKIITLTENQENTDNKKNQIDQNKKNQIEPQSHRQKIGTNVQLKRDI